MGLEGHESRPVAARSPIRVLVAVFLIGAALGVLAGGLVDELETGAGRASSSPASLVLRGAPGPAAGSVRLTYLPGLGDGHTPACFVIRGATTNRGAWLLCG